jgi:hypothetical protein
MGTYSWIQNIAQYHAFLYLWTESQITKLLLSNIHFNLSPLPNFLSSSFRFSFFYFFLSISFPEGHYLFYLFVLYLKTLSVTQTTVKNIER